VPACSRPPSSRKIRWDKVVDHSLLINYLGDPRHDLNHRSPEGALTHTGTTAVPCMGQEVGSLKAVQSSVNTPFISPVLSTESRVWRAKG